MVVLLQSWLLVCTYMCTSNIMPKTALLCFDIVSGAFQDTELKAKIRIGQHKYMWVNIFFLL